MLTKDGRKQIKEDVLKSSMIADTIKQIATNDTVDISDFFSNTNKEHTTYEAIKKKIANDPILAKKLNDKNLSDADKEVMMNAITKTVQKELGYTKTDNKLISTNKKGRDNKDIKGFYSNETKTSYINEKNITNGNEGLVKVSGVEMQRAIDYENNTLNSNSTKEYRDQIAKFSQNVGDNEKNYTNFALDFTNQGSMTTSNTSKVNVVTTTQVQSVFNSTAANNIEFAGVDKVDGDNNPLLLIPIFLAIQKYANAPEKKNDIKTGMTGSENLLLPLVSLKVVSLTKEAGQKYLGQTLKTSVFGGTTAATVDTVSQIGIQIGEQMYNNNSMNPSNINYNNINVNLSQVGLSGLTGIILAPSMLNTVINKQKGSFRYSNEAWKKLQKQQYDTKSVSKLKKLQPRINAHTNTQWNHIKFQGTTYGLNEGVKLITSEDEQK